MDEGTGVTDLDVPGHLLLGDTTDLMTQLHDEGVGCTSRAGEDVETHVILQKKTPRQDYPIAELTTQVLCYYALAYFQRYT